jgi:hypothetical protein
MSAHIIFLRGIKYLTYTQKIYIWILINSKKEYNIKLIAVVAIVSIILVSSVAAGGAYYLLSDDSSTEQEETYGMYENIPSESDFVMQVDSIGLVEDQITRDIANELHEEYLGSSGNWYNQSLESGYNSTNQQLNSSEITSDVDIRIKDVNNIMIFGQYGENISLDQIENTDNVNVSGGYLMDINLSQSEIETIIENSNDSELNTTEYKNHTIYKNIEAMNSANEQEFHGVVLEDNIIALSNSEEFTKNIIDTHKGDTEHINTSLIPENYDDTYVSLSMDNIGPIYDEVMMMYDDIENDPAYQQMSEENKQRIKDLKEMPTPQKLQISYTTDGNKTMYLDSQFTFDTLKAASEVNWYFEESNESIQTDVTLDTTTVRVNQKTTSDVVIKSIKEYGEKITNPYASIADADISQSENYVNGTYNIDVTLSNKKQIDYAYVQVINNQDAENNITQELTEEGSLSSVPTKHKETAMINNGDKVTIQELTGNENIIVYGYSQGDSNIIREYTVQDTMRVS